LLASGAATAWLAPAALGADSVYWTNTSGGAIRVGNLDGTGSPASLFTGESNVFGVAIDPASGKVYWDRTDGLIRVGNLDGTGSPATLFTGESAPQGVAIDATAGRIYWTNYNSGTIRVGNLNGSGSPQTLFTGAQPEGVAIDPALGKVYWADGGSNGIWVGNLDGSGTAQSLFSSEMTPSGVAIDTSAGKIYWADSSLGTIRVGNVNGSGSPQDLFMSEGFPEGVAIDPSAGKIYWIANGYGTIRVGNLDGTGSPATLFTTIDSPSFLALLRSPAGTGAPQVSGGSTTGSVLTCLQGMWASDLVGAFLYRAPRDLAYQWSLNGNDIAGATASTYTASSAGTYACRVTATNQAGSSAQTSAGHAVSAPGSPPPPPLIPTKATLSNLHETNSIFAVAKPSTPLTGHTAATRHKRGTVFSFQLDQPATIKITITTKAPGRRVGHSCRPDSRRLRHHPRCTRTIKLATLTRTAHAGKNKIAFSGRIRGKALKPRRYQAIFTAIDKAGTSKPKTLSFTIVMR
jgi:hypothetical protein